MKSSLSSLIFGNTILCLILVCAATIARAQSIGSADCSDCSWQFGGAGPATGGSLIEAVCTNNATLSADGFVQLDLDFSFYDAWSYSGVSSPYAIETDAGAWDSYFGNEDEVSSAIDCSGNTSGDESSGDAYDGDFWVSAESDIC